MKIGASDFHHHFCEAKGYIATYTQGHSAHNISRCDMLLQPTLNSAEQAWQQSISSQDLLRLRSPQQMAMRSVHESSNNSIVKLLRPK